MGIRDIALRLNRLEALLKNVQSVTYMIDPATARQLKIEDKVDLVSKETEECLQDIQQFKQLLGL